MRDYDNYSDEELVIRIRDGEKEISDYLISKYKNLVLKRAKSMFIVGGDNDDLIQEGMIGLYKAIRDYDSGRDATFFTFADICVSRQILTAIEASSRKKHSPLNNYVSIYDEHTDESGDGGRSSKFIETLGIVTDTEPENFILNQELINEVYSIIENDLSKLEQNAFRLYVAGEGVQDIAKILSRDEKSTDNALQRAKAKLKKALNNI